MPVMPAYNKNDAQLWIIVGSFVIPSVKYFEHDFIFIAWSEWIFTKQFCYLDALLSLKSVVSRAREYSEQNTTELKVNIEILKLSLTKAWDQ